MYSAFGHVLIAASGIEAGNAHMTGGWTGFYLHLAGAALFGVTGYMLLTHARTSAEAPSLIVAVYFIAAGIFNIVAPTPVGPSI